MNTSVPDKENAGITAFQFQWLIIFHKNTKMIISYAGSLFTEREDALPTNLVKSWSHEVGCYNDRIALKFDSAAAEVPVKFLGDWKSVAPNLTASRLHEICR